MCTVQQIITGLGSEEVIIVNEHNFGWVVDLGRYYSRLGMNGK